MGDLERLDGRWALVLQWVDLDNEGHRIMLPHEVLERLLSPRRGHHEASAQR